MNLTFQVEIQTDTAGDREIMGIECEPTHEEVSPEPMVDTVGPGSWLLAFVLPDDFDGSESVFRWFRRYGIEPEVAYEACREATDTTVS